jgi:hypothetical protein
VPASTLSIGFGNLSLSSARDVAVTLDADELPSASVTVHPVVSATQSIGIDIPLTIDLNDRSLSGSNALGMRPKRAGSFEAFGLLSSVSKLGENLAAMGTS